MVGSRSKRTPSCCTCTASRMVGGRRGRLAVGACVRTVTPQQQRTEQAGEGAGEERTSWGCVHDVLLVGASCAPRV